MAIMKVLFTLLLFLQCATCIALDVAEIQQINKPESNYSDGSINITTGCIFNITDSVRHVKWYTVEGNVIRKYEPNKTEIIDIEELCSPESYNGESVKRLTLGFHHKEATGDTKEVKFRVTFDHDSNPTKTLSLTTKNFYKIDRVVSMSCTPLSPKINSTFTCTCQHAKGKSIEWFKGNLLIAACSASKNLCVPRRGIYYKVNSWMNGSVSYYNLTVKRSTYSDCIEFRCLDFSYPPNEAKQRASVTALDVTEFTGIAEPEFNYTGGIINVTTGCILNKGVGTLWYTVEDNMQTEYRLQKGNVINTRDGYDCESCNGVSKSRWTFGFHHKEATVNSKEVKFRVTIFHENLGKILTLTTKNFYRIETNDKCRPNRSFQIAILVVCCMATCILHVILCVVVKWKAKIYSSWRNLTNFPEKDESTAEDNKDVVKHNEEAEVPMISGTDERIQFKRVENSDSGKRGDDDIDYDSDDIIDVDDNGGDIDKRKH